ncbi:hypothetical protein HY839_01900 [Candidatus Azambacteria bacterium]|nr:hypothetical protein [Candidatus Azambacteria bacterium]
MKNASKKNLFPKITLEFNKDWELKNWVDSCVKNISYDAGGHKKWDLGGIPQEIELLAEKTDSEEKILPKIEKVLDKFLKTPKATHIIKDISARAEKRWGEAGKECLLGLSKMLDIPLKEFEKEYRAYFTFGKRIPFGKNSFMFNQFSDFPNTASHEIMHIEFLKRYSGYCNEKGLGEKQVGDLKEILTVLLNEDLSEFLYLPDRGYYGHKEIRQKVLQLYKKHKKTKQNFTLFLDKVIELIKTPAH